MTHSSGFEYSAIDNAAQDLGDLVPVRDWLVSHIPRRVRPPGEYAGYSNYSAVLAGYVVARVYGMPYKEYVQQEILDPLGMTYSAIGTGASPELERSSTMGYTYSDGAFLPFPRYWAQPAMVPSAGLASSATDMARFTIAYPEDGRYGEARILQAETVQQMRRSLFPDEPRLCGAVDSAEARFCFPVSERIPLE